MKEMDKNKLSYVEPEINSLKINHEYSMAALSVVIKNDFTNDDAGAKKNLFSSSDIGEDENDGSKE